MNLNYAIFKSEHIMTINDLAQIGLHNKREKKAYNSNPDIDIERTLNKLLKEDKIIKISGGRYTKYKWNNN